MSWSCYFLEEPPMESYVMDGITCWFVDTKQLRVGALWYARGDDGKVVSEEQSRGMHLTQHYWMVNSSRPPLMLALPVRYSTGPGVGAFCVDGQCHNKDRGYYDGWTVSGNPPLITINPSVNRVGSYHGWVRNGTVSADVDGRTFPGL